MSNTTKKVVNDYNKMNNEQFKMKYFCTKKRYNKRVKKYGDPYVHRINTKSFKLLKRLAKCFN